MARRGRRTIPPRHRGCNRPPPGVPRRETAWRCDRIGSRARVNPSPPPLSLTGRGVTRVERRNFPIGTVLSLTILPSPLDGEGAGGEVFYPFINPCWTRKA